MVDGGTQESGKALVGHIRNHYDTNTVNFLICTHPDKDHASGLSVIMDELQVQQVIMHCPWNYIDDIWDAVNDGRITKDSLKQKLMEGHPYAYALYEQANEKSIPILYPFSDFDLGLSPLYIAGPSYDFYLNQLVNFRSMTDVMDDEVKSEGLLSDFASAVTRAISWLTESWDNERLENPDDDATSAENNSSVISFFNLDGKKVLLTGDAGVPALTKAADKIEELGFELQNFAFVQVPHHGSKRNIGPTILDRLVGTTGLFGQNTSFAAFISAAVEGEPKHPNKRVINAFIRRGGKVIATQGRALCHFTSGCPSRGWGEAQPLPFYDQVEDDD